MGNIKRYFGANAYKNIKSLKEDVLDQWNDLDELYWMYQIESISEEWTYKF